MTLPHMHAACAPTSPVVCERSMPLPFPHRRRCRAGPALKRHQGKPESWNAVLKLIMRHIRRCGADGWGRGRRQWLHVLTMPPQQCGLRTTKLRLRSVGYSRGNSGLRWSPLPARCARAADVHGGPRRSGVSSRASCRCVDAPVGLHGAVRRGRAAPPARARRAAARGEGGGKRGSCADGPRRTGLEGQGADVEHCVCASTVGLEESGQLRCLAAV